MGKLIWRVHRCLLATRISLQLSLSNKSIKNIHIHYFSLILPIQPFYIVIRCHSIYFICCVESKSWVCLLLHWKRNLIARNYSSPVLDIQGGDISSARVYMWVNSCSLQSYVFNSHFSTTCAFFPLYVSGCTRLMSCLLMLHVKLRRYSLYLPPSQPNCHVQLCYREY